MSTVTTAVALAAALGLGAETPRPLTLDEAVELALSSSPDVAVHHVAVERARLQTLRANLERIHASVDATASALYVSPPFVPVSGTSASYGALLPLANLEASVSAPLFSGFRVSADIARAEHLEKAVAEDLAAERHAVALAVARAYWSERRLALLEGAQLAAAERLLESERLIQARISAGLAAGLDANRAAARRVQLDVEATTLAAQRREARARLAVLLGIDEEIELVGAATAAVAPEPTVSSVVQRALDQRPELRATGWRTLALAEEKRAHESAYWPQLDAGVLAQLGNNPSVAGVGSRAIAGINGDVQAGLFLRMNLFDTFATHPRRRGSGAPPAPGCPRAARADAQHRERGARGARARELAC
jgi:outer membrane protein TolC